MRLQLKAVPAPDPGVKDGRLASPDEEAAPGPDSPDADPRALSPNGATGYFADQWGEMEAWFFDDGDTLVGYIRTPQEVIRVDDIDEWVREVDEAGLEQADQSQAADDGAGDDPTPSGEPPAPEDAATEGMGGGSAAGQALQDTSGLFDFSALEAKHLPGQHQQRRHGNRYGVSAGKRVLRRAARAAGNIPTGRRSAPSGPTNARRQPGDAHRPRRAPTPPPAPETPPVKQRPRLVVEDDPDSRLPFNPDRVRSVQDLWEMNTDDATVDQFAKARINAAEARRKAAADGDADGVDAAIDLLDELDELHGQKLDQALRDAGEKKRADDYRKMMARERDRKRSGSNLEGSPLTEAEMIEQLELAARSRRDIAAEETGGWFWSRDALDAADRGDLQIPYSETDIFAGRVPRDFLNRHISEELGRYFDDNGWPASPRKAAGVVRDDTGENPDGAWEQGRAKKRDDRLYR